MITGIIISAISVSCLVFACFRINIKNYSKNQFLIMLMLLLFILAMRFTQIRGASFCFSLMLSAIFGPYPAMIIASLVSLLRTFLAGASIFSFTCDLLNACVLPCLWLYPFVYKAIAGENENTFRQILAALLSCLLSLQLLSFLSIIESILMHKANSSFADLIIQFQLPYFITGLLEGLITAGLLIFIKKKNPIFYNAARQAKRLDSAVPVKALVIALAVLIAIASGSAVLTSFTSPQEDDTIVELLSGTAEASSGGTSSDLRTTLSTPLGGRAGKSLSKQKQGSTYDSGSSTGRKAASIITIVIVIIFVLVVLFAKKREDKDAK